jgi:hypothetical protein
MKMKMFRVVAFVTHIETYEFLAKDEDDALEKIGCIDPVDREYEQADGIKVEEVTSFKHIPNPEGELPDAED